MRIGCWHSFGVGFWQCESGAQVEIADFGGLDGLMELMPLAGLTLLLTGCGSGDHGLQAVQRELSFANCS